MKASGAVKFYNDHLIKLRDEAQEEMAALKGKEDNLSLVSTASLNGKIVGLEMALAGVQYVLLQPEIFNKKEDNNV